MGLSGVLNRRSEVEVIAKVTYSDLPSMVRSSMAA
jgi:hypothetical protein